MSDQVLHVGESWEQFSFEHKDERDQLFSNRVSLEFLKWFVWEVSLGDLIEKCNLFTSLQDVEYCCRGLPLVLAGVFRLFGNNFQNIVYFHFRRHIIFHLIDIFTRDPCHHAYDDEKTKQIRMKLHLDMSHCVTETIKANEDEVFFYTNFIQLYNQSLYQSICSPVSVSSTKRNDLYVSMSSCDVILDFLTKYSPVSSFCLINFEYNFDPFFLTLYLHFNSSTASVSSTWILLGNFSRVNSMSKTLEHTRYLGFFEYDCKSITKFCRIRVFLRRSLPTFVY